MTTLAELARLIRSKNAGPFTLTFDMMFEKDVTYERVKRSGALTPAVIGKCFNVAPEKVQLFFCDNALAVKASIPRPVSQGDLLDADGHGGQQYAPLMGIEIPDV